MMKQITQGIVVHGGAASSTDDRDGCEAAAQQGADVLNNGGSAIDAVIQAVKRLEDDGRYNAGYGSVIILDDVLDNLSVEMDAAVMDSQGILGAVACITTVRNPILVAKAVNDTPHWLLAGQGADHFAKACGFELRKGPSPQALKKRDELIAKLQSGKDETASRGTNWQYAMSRENAVKSFGSGTVGAVALDSNGTFAVATSTGGCAPSLWGRVGDTPIIGCGFFAGAQGAIAVTGVGEYIVPRMLARSVYEAAITKNNLTQAIEEAIADFPSDIDLGIIGISNTEIVMKSNRDMACAEVQK
jgi:L-asparaginase/beta-aspartyl-peptidase (threonine type)